MKYARRPRSGNRGETSLPSISQQLKSPLLENRQGGPLPYLRKIAMPPEPILETAGACHAVGDQGLAAVVPFLNQTLAHAKPMALDGRTTVSTNANLRKARDLLCHCLCLRACAPLRGEV